MVGDARRGSPEALLLLVRPGRERGAGCVPGTGSDPVRRLLRPDADPVLLPGRVLGHGRPGARDDQDGDLHDGRLVPDAGRGDRHRRDRLRRSRDRDQFHVQRAFASADPAQGRGLDLPCVRACVPREDADRAVPRLAGRCLQVDADPRRRRVLRCGRQGRELRLPADRPAAVPERLASLPAADADHRAGLDHVGDRDGLHDPRCAPGDRILERRADGLHPARDLLAAARGRAGRAAADAQPRRRHRRVVLCGGGRGGPLSAAARNSTT